MGEVLSTLAKHHIKMMRNSILIIFLAAIIIWDCSLATPPIEISHPNCKPTKQCAAKFDGRGECYPEKQPGMVCFQSQELCPNRSSKEGCFCCAKPSVTNDMCEPTRACMMWGWQQGGTGICLPRIILPPHPKWAKKDLCNFKVTGCWCALVVRNVKE